LIFDVENDENEKIIENIEMGITRHFKGDILEVKFKDLRKNTDVRVDLNIELNHFDVVSTTFDIIANEKHEAFSALSYYQLQDKISSCRKIILREKSTKVQVMEATISVKEDNTEDIRRKIDFYKRLIKIQSYFKVNFDLPDIFDEDSIRTVYEVSDLIKTGITQTPPIQIKIDRKEVGVEVNLELGQEFLIHFSFTGVELFGQLIEFNKATLLSPHTVLKEKNEQYLVFCSKKPCLYIWNEKYGEFDPVELAKKNC
jgi:hypothetical protein